ncbi:AbrB family transcriptional regulator [Halovulum dunhuangense]|uniref:AbrB family transcriptional regulator n=1 Tax=Halovulum dunhuangense TaxID=1505036 RepID=UPI0031B64165
MKPPAPPHAGWRFLFALCLSALGGAVFAWAAMPLPWLLGAMTATMLAALLRLPVHAPAAIRPYVVTVIGVMLGSGFTPALLGHLGSWALSLLFVGLYLIVSGLIVVPYYRILGGQDRATAYFSGMPGGLSEMMIIGRDMGGDDRKIVLAHTARIFLCVCLVAFWFRVFGGLEAQGAGGRLGIAFAQIPPHELVLLALAGVAGFVLGRRLRIPAPTMIGPMLVSAALHMGGLVVSPPPSELVIAAQVILGTIVGVRFLGAAPGEVLRALALGLGATLIMIGVSLGFALGLERLIGQGFVQILLGFAPGGFTEMSLIALALQADVAYVATHHMVRIILVILLAPLIFALWRGKTPEV